MGNTDQTPLRIHLLCTSKHESPEAHIVFDMTENRLHLGGTRNSEPVSLWTGQVFPGFLSIFKQAETDADLAVALGLCALLAEGTIGAVAAFIISPIRDIPIFGCVARGVLEMQLRTSRT